MALPDNKSNLPLDGDQPPISQQPASYYPAAPQPPPMMNYNAPPPPSLNQMTNYNAPPPAMNQVTLHQPASISPLSIQPTSLGMASLGAQPQIQWMIPPAATPSCPRGLECLTELDQVNIAQQFNFIELVRGIDMANRYDVKNKFGQQIFIFVEERMPCQCCGCFSQLFHMRGFDGNNNEVIHFSRPVRCNLCCCCPCICDCLEDMTVEAPTGNVIGSCIQISRIGPKYEVLDSERNKICNVRGPFGVCTCYGLNANYTFQVTDENDQSVGTIVKYWAGMRAVAAQDRLDINFPIDLDVKKKALIVATGILIDYISFQRVQTNRRN